MMIDSIRNEIQWRYDLLAEIGGKPANYAVDPAILRDWRIYGGQQGIWVDKQRTAAITDDGNGIAVGLLHKGNIYPDDFDETGVIYHYPVTNRPPSRDLGEIESVKNCGRLKVPVFVITLSPVEQSKRDVYFGFVTMWDDRAKVFIVEFGTDQKLIAAKEADKPFVLQTHEPKATYEATSRPGQAAFRIAVFRRYGAQCAVCEMSIIDLLDAAHLVSKSEEGSDDARNGLPLCVLHHRAYDKGLFAINPNNLSLILKPLGPSKSELGVTKNDICHLGASPHPSALEYAWENWLRKNKSA
jgi:putative restriction endonuclease